MSVPSEVMSYLIPDETILKEWSVRDLRIYATQYRVFLIKGGIFSKKVVEASYAHISSIEFTRERPLSWLLAAILSLILSYLTFAYFPELFGMFIPPILLSLFGYLFILIGIGFLIWFIIGIQGFVIYVVGRPPIKISKELTDMVRFVRERRP